MDIGRVQSGIPLQGGNQPNDPAKIADAARQLETQFAKMLISSMRATSLGDSMFPGSAEHYRQMYDDQLAAALTRGKGLGLQTMIRRQLGGEAATATPQQAARMYSMDGYRQLLPARQAAALSALDGAALPPGAGAAAAPGGDSQPRANGSESLSARLARLIAAEAAPTAKAASLMGAGVAAPLGAASVAASTVGAASAAIDDCHGTPASDARPGTPEAFVARIWPHAQRAAAELGVCPKVLVAQAALETGWGRHMIRGNAGDANNLFGIKTGGRWSGETVTAATSEFRNGTRVQENAAFRAYRSIADSFGDYVALLKNSPRYAAALGQGTARAFANALQRAGYATDPQYAAKLTAIAEGPTLNRALARLSGPTA